MSMIWVRCVLIDVMYDCQAEVQNIYDVFCANTNVTVLWVYLYDNTYFLRNKIRHLKMVGLSGQFFLLGRSVYVDGLSDGRLTVGLLTTLEVHLHKDWHIDCGFWVGKEGVIAVLHPKMQWKKISHLNWEGGSNKLRHNFQVIHLHHSMQL